MSPTASYASPVGFWLSLISLSAVVIYCDLVVSSILRESFGCVRGDSRPRQLSGSPLEVIFDALVPPTHVSVFATTFLLLTKAGLEFLEDEVVEMMRGVDVDGSDSIEWQVIDGHKPGEKERGLGT